MTNEPVTVPSAPSAPSAPAAPAAAPAGPPDPRPGFARALDQVDALVAAVTVADLGRPTPCEGWSVADLVGHLVGVEHRIVHILGGGDPADVPAHADDVAPEDRPAAWTAARPALEEAVAEDDLLDRIVTHPAGRMPGRIALGIYTSELATHGWDLAAALGRTDALDQDLAAAVLGPMTAALPAEGRDDLPFGPVVEVADDAAPYDRLLGWLGRDPAWQPAG